MLNVVPSLVTWAAAGHRPTKPMAPVRKNKPNKSVDYCYGEAKYKYGNRIVQDRRRNKCQLEK